MADRARSGPLLSATDERQLDRPRQAYPNSQPKSPRAPNSDADQEARGLTTQAYLCAPQGGTRCGDAAGLRSSKPTSPSMLRRKRGIAGNQIHHRNSPRPPIWDADQGARGLTTEAYLRTPQGGTRRSAAEMRPKRGIAGAYSQLRAIPNPPTLGTNAPLRPYFRQRHPV